jgi:hypothetical protein
MKNNTLRVFINKDTEYLAWIATNRNGFVVNCHRIPQPNFLILHRSNCTHVNPPKHKHWTSVGFIKACAATVNELETWAKEGTGGQLKPCPSCLAEHSVQSGSLGGTGLYARPGATPSEGTGLHPRPGAAPSAGTATQAPPASAVAAQGPATAAAGGKSAIVLRSGLHMIDPPSKILQFCRMEYAYFDGIADTDPDRIEPLDVLVTVASIAEINADPLVVREMHLQMAERCDPLLSKIPADADLLAFDPALEQLHQLLLAAFQAPLLPITAAAKILYRKRRGYFPALTTPALHYYLDISNRQPLKDALRRQSQGATIFAKICKLFREDLKHVAEEVDKIRADLAKQDYPLSRVRILELLL